MKWPNDDVVQWPSQAQGKARCFLPSAFCRLPPAACRLSLRGQSTIELVILVAAVTAALVAMAIYLQRGYQGYIRGTSQAHGIQFNPTEPFTDTRRLNSYTRNQTVDVTSGEADVPVLGGTLPERILTTKVRTVTNWDVARDARYEAQ